jgi:hypothetical protein
MTKTWNSRPKNLRIGPQFQGFLLTWSEICSTTVPWNAKSRPHLLVFHKFVLFTSITCFAKHVRLIILHSIHPKKGPAMLLGQQASAIASRQPTRQRWILKKSKKLYLPGSQMVCFEVSVVVLVVYCFIAIPHANCDWGEVLMAVEDCFCCVSLPKRLLWRIFGRFVDDRIELLSENTTNSVCRVKGANGDWLVVK